MALALGSSLASKVYLGATEINLAYFGATQVYSSSAFSAEAQNYFDRLDAAGDTTYVDYKQPLANYIDGLVTLGGAYWDTMSTAASFVGVGIQGVTVPLRSGMPVLTNNFFIAGDLDQLRGLKGDGSTKWLSTGFDSATLGQDDYSISCYVTQRATLANNYLVGGAIDAFIAGNPNAQQVIVKNRSNSGINLNAISVSNFHGSSRTVSTEFDVQINGQSLVAVGPSRAPFPEIDGVFSRSAGQNKSDGRIAAYHIGPAIDLLPLEALQDTLITEVAEAQFSAEAANYFARLAVSGDTTHYAYRQPLANYIDSLVSLGGAYWDTMESAASFVGVGIQGVTVPLRDGMTVPTQNNFVVGDLDQLTGLLSDSSTKSISTNTNQSNYAQNDISASVYRTETVSGTNNFYFGTNLADGFGARQSFVTACHGTQAVTGSASTTVGLLGLSRSVSTGYDYRSNGTTGTRTTASVAPAAGNLDIFAINGVRSGSFRLATYHAGPALNLATLEGLQATLLSEIRTAHTFVAAASYFSRLAAAGDTTHVAYKQPLTNYITSLVELGGAYWDTMLSSASFVGVGIQGITVPLRAGMASITNVNNNFVAGDLDQLTGLKGDGSTKYINTGLSSSVMSLDDTSISVYQNTASTTFTDWLLGNALFTALRADGSTYVNGPVASAGAPVSPTFYGASRNSSTNVDVRVNGTTSNFARTSSSTGAADYLVFGYSSAALADARLATYHVGPALNLATLEGLQATLLSEIAGIGFSTEAANYFSRLVSAGDTTFLAYRQPLANYIDSLVTLGGAYWDDMKSAASFVGVGIKGITVPLRAGMTVPTQNNFVAADLDQLTGLKGDGSLKYLDTQIVESVHSQNNVSTSVYVTELYLPGGGTPYSYSAISDGTDAVQITTIVSKFYNRCVGFTNDIIVAPANNSLIGVSRSIGTEFKNYAGGLEQTNVANSSPFSGTATGKLFTNVNASSSFSSPRLATYHLGPALDLATLEALQDTLITEIAAI